MNRKWGCAIRNPSPELPPQVDGGNAHSITIYARKNRLYLRNGSSDPLHVWFYDRFFGVDGPNGSISAIGAITHVLNIQ